MTNKKTPYKLADTLHYLSYSDEELKERGIVRQDLYSDYCNQLVSLMNKNVWDSSLRAVNLSFYNNPQRVFLAKEFIGRGYGISMEQALIGSLYSELLTAVHNIIILNRGSFFDKEKILEQTTTRLIKNLVEETTYYTDNTTNAFLCSGEVPYELRGYNDD
jgi:hypothetical protein